MFKFELITFKCVILGKGTHNMEEISTLGNENENYPFTFHFTTSFVEKKPRQKTIQVKALFMGNKYMCCILHCHFYHINRSLDVL